ncbi:hypothetical protein TSUD_320730 [Trifolium subterraneum]|uniref:Methyltransferase type 11 domain-containing protein n=1 Tax=Trifolium subterraneum TaxID=3900 RepID=A0A2Z6N2L6_TRISU|nr:hypothetical protein TSUD_320730 [Trifolium subterraneum]
MSTGTQAYGESWYWDNRYTNEPGPFDWYQKYITLAPIINLYVPLNQSILVVAFSEGMVDEGGYKDVVNIDISSVVIDAMQKKYRDRPQLKYLKMDVRDMGAFESESFGSVVDKGTLDSILCGNNSRQNATRMLEEIWRVLKNKGVYILVTYGAPQYRLRLLRDSCSWTIKLHLINNPPTSTHHHHCPANTFLHHPEWVVGRLVCMRQMDHESGDRDNGREENSWQ